MLKRAGTTDVSMIVAFEAEVMNLKLYGKPLDHTAATAEINTNDYYVQLSGDRIIATGALRRRDDGSAYVSNIAVHPKARRKGYARAMMWHLLAQCDDAPSIDLAVHPDNQAACALYASLGFKPTLTIENYFGDGEPRTIMQRLSSA
jgi:ribosomal protein S18 acetylase RimI-like enzyme